MAENNDLLKVPFIRETDGFWHLRYQSNGDPVFFHIDSGTKKFEANILTAHIGLVENRVEFMDRPSFLNGIQSREFFLNYNEGIYVDLRSNVPVSYCGILGSLEQSEQPSLAITSDETSASIAITDSDGNSIATGDDITVLLSTNGGRDLLTYEGEPVELTEAGEYDVISYVLEEGSLPNASDIVHVSIAGKEPDPPTPPTPSTGDYMYFEAVEANSKIILASSLTTAPDFEYSTDGSTWNTWNYMSDQGTHLFDTINLNSVGDRVYIRGNNPNGLSFFDDEQGIEQMTLFALSSGKINAGGNIMSLLDKTLATSVIPANAFSFLFAGLGNPNEWLLTPPSFDTVTEIEDYGCASMYSDCTSLTSAADMPLLTIIGQGGCRGMYDGCTFAMSSDGTTLNFAFPTPPITAGETTYSTAYDLAQWMGNTNGFTTP